MTIQSTLTSSALRWFAHLQDHGVSVDLRRRAVSFPTVELFVQLVTPELERKLTDADFMVLRPASSHDTEALLRAEQRGVRLPPNLPNVTLTKETP